MKKIIINSLEQISNGYLCDYDCYVKSKTKKNKDILIKRNYKIFINSPIRLGRLLIRLLDSEEKEGGFKINNEK